MSEPTAPRGRLLPLTPVHAAPRLRADAVRNRARLLEAATRLAAEHGAANLTMEAVAAAASVGKGTVSRRFGDRNGLLLALLDHQEQRLQEAFITGPPPLGPGADPVRRLLAFGPAVMRHEHAHRDLYLAADPGPDRRFTVPARRVRIAHLTTLLRQATGDADVDVLAHTLLASLDIALVHHLTTRLGMPPARVEAGWTDLVTRLTAR
ncbi:TetR/AcrR family transcriptional regulator [Saccharothrix longispora]|uniref:AcrR family transcriptional regulator n=1 Tax=Saccharothrix longispora TaxID=33920 RepID=A0ABU1PQA3_9PSEU|nr:helix-turn-helix domain-containing protein [Saccharothrix longispora]MDR6592838.1 AcrR family transcriptional regulator [Saccharothrix longispora]